MDCAGNARRALSQMHLLGQGDEAAVKSTQLSN